MNNKLAVMKKEKFAEGYYNFYKLVLLFALGCFIGDLYEVLLHFIKNGELVQRRGVIYGPFNPVYGFGLLLMVLLLGRVKRNFKIFIYGSVIGGVFEYMCSFIQEKVFGTYAWDYSDLFLNINGRTTVIYAMFWGVLALGVIKVIVPLMSLWIEKIPVKFGKAFTICLAVFLVWDMSISCLAAERDYRRQLNLEAKNVIDIYLDEYYPEEVIRKVYQNSKYITDIEENALIGDNNQ
ncbi:MAG: putative ABC transporter permease [Clostridia bacterium]|nr:putative ABC transporter permease [Clostridia bacterium]